MFRPRDNPLPKQQTWDGSHVISPEELETALSQDPYIKKLEAEVENELTRLIDIRLKRDAAKRLHNAMRHQVIKSMSRVLGYRRRLETEKAQVRIRLAYEKLEKARKEIFK